jgi:UDP-GlcNAc:undecaprenyl-phosphate GlcNAc-1-phosphate transferase
MGDAGSQFLGFVLAGLAVIGASLDAGRISFYVLPIVFYTFMFDFAVTLAVRAMRKRGLMRPHREFMFQVWHRAGWPAPRICLIYFGGLTLNGAVAMIAQWGDPWLRLYAVVALAVPHLALAWAVYRTGRRAGLFVARRQ